MCYNGHVQKMDRRSDVDWTDDEIEMFKDETFGNPSWESSICSCTVYTSKNRIRVKSCDYEHFVWVWRVGVPIVEEKCRKKSIGYPKPGYKKTLQNYLEWGINMPLSFGYVLDSYAHGKASREWHIKNWKEGIEKKLFFPEEFIGTLGCNEDNFESIFGRKIDETLRSILLGTEKK